MIAIDKKIFLKMVWGDPINAQIYKWLMSKEFPDNSVTNKFVIFSEYFIK